MQSPAEGAFRPDISEMAKFYIGLKNTINYEQVLLFSNLQCLCKSLIPFQDAQQCVLNWTLIYTHYLTLQILGMAHPLKSLEPEPSVRVGLSLQYLNQKWNKSGHVGVQLCRMEAPKCLNSGKFLVAQQWQSMKFLLKLCWFVKGGREANPGRRIQCHGKERKAVLSFYKQSVFRALNKRYFFWKFKSWEQRSPNSLYHLVQPSVPVPQAELLYMWNENDWSGTNVHPSSLELCWLSHS